jgi:hypothetical protein
MMKEPVSRNSSISLTLTQTTTTSTMHRQTTTLNRTATSLGQELLTPLHRRSANKYRQHTPLTSQYQTITHLLY